ncbi:MAG TPA: dockerin type I repeat-containing protein, partial [Tepidisphaeraceae bacterium]
IPGNYTTTMNGSTLTNNGKLVINPEQNSYVTALDFDSDALLNGSGEILLNQAGSAAELNVINGHTLTIGADQLIDGAGQINGALVNYGTIRADAEGQTLEITSAITNPGKLDVTGGVLLLDQGLNGTSILAQLRSGSNNGNGIISSLAVTQRGSGVGYTNNGAAYTFVYTWLGDANLDGSVDSADLSAISATGTNWSTGDFNYDGKVDQDDYALFMLGNAESRGANISTTLPEPSIIFGAALLLAACQRRRQYGQ